MHSFALPASLREIMDARRLLAEHYAETGLQFSLDGKLVGDIGEALAWEHFSISLCSGTPGIDGHVGELSVQVKTSASRRGGAFRWREVNADHLLVFCLDLSACSADLIFNGPQKYVLKTPFVGQRSVSRAQLTTRDKEVEEKERLPQLLRPGRDPR